MYWHFSSEAAACVAIYRGVKRLSGLIHELVSSRRRIPQHSARRTWTAEAIIVNGNNCAWHNASQGAWKWSCCLKLLLEAAVVDEGPAAHSSPEVHLELSCVGSRETGICSVPTYVAMDKQSTGGSLKPSLGSRDLRSSSHAEE